MSDAQKLPPWVYRLRDFLRRMRPPLQEDFARRCGTTLGQLKQVNAGNRTASPHLAIAIDRETGGYVRMDEVCPSVDWEYVRKAAKNIGKKVVEADYDLDAIVAEYVSKKLKKGSKKKA